MFNITSNSLDHLTTTDHDRSRHRVEVVPRMEPRTVGRTVPPMALRTERLDRLATSTLHVPKPRHVALDPMDG
jgi:hypothetical protein